MLWNTRMVPNKYFNSLSFYYFQYQNVKKIQIVHLTNIVNWVIWHAQILASAILADQMLMEPLAHQSIIFVIANVLKVLLEILKLDAVSSSHFIWNIT